MEKNWQFALVNHNIEFRLVLQHETILTIKLNLGTALRRMWDEVRGEDKELNKIFIMQVFANIFVQLTGCNNASYNQGNNYFNLNYQL